MLKLCRRHDRVLMSGWHNTLQTRLVISGNVNLRQRPSSKNKNVHGRPRHLCLCPRFKPRASASNASQRGLRDCSRRSWTMHPSTGEGAQGKGRARARQHGSMARAGSRLHKELRTAALRLLPTRGPHGDKRTSERARERAPGVSGPA